MSRLTATEYADKIKRHVNTVLLWLANSLKPASERNSSLPPIVARKVGRDWRIDVEATERAQALRCGNALERDLTRRAAK